MGGHRRQGLLLAIRAALIQRRGVVLLVDDVLPAQRDARVNRGGVRGHLPAGDHFFRRSAVQPGLPQRARHHAARLERVRQDIADRHANWLHRLGLKLRAHAQEGIQEVVIRLRPAPGIWPVAPGALTVVFAAASTH